MAQAAKNAAIEGRKEEPRAAALASLSSVSCGGSLKAVVRKSEIVGSQIEQYSTKLRTAVSLHQFFFPVDFGDVDFGDICT
jgi:hypothetical protein